MTDRGRIVASLILAGVLLLFLFVRFAQGQQLEQREEIQAPVEVRLKRKVDYSPRLVEAVYWQACLQVATELRPQWSLNRRAGALHPRVVLILGADQDVFRMVDIWHGSIEVELKQWDADKFAQAVVNAALSFAIDEDAKRRLAHRAALDAVTAISVHDLIQEQKSK